MILFFDRHASLQSVYLLQIGVFPVRRALFRQRQINPLHLIAAVMGSRTAMVIGRLNRRFPQLPGLSHRVFPLLLTIIIMGMAI